ncbi:MAG: hypothetical protein JXR78_05480 [Victivallales bacterium]|nr:hypothetical protein [Victivallales bacterium]
MTSLVQCSILRVFASKATRTGKKIDTLGGIDQPPGVFGLIDVEENSR